MLTCSGIRRGMGQTEKEAWRWLRGSGSWGAIRVRRLKLFQLKLSCFGLQPPFKGKEAQILLVLNPLWKEGFLSGRIPIHGLWARRNLTGRLEGVRLLVIGSAGAIL